MNKGLKLLLISNTVFVFAGNLIVPLYAVFVAQLGGGIQLAGSLYAIKFVSTSFTELLIIRINDKKYLDRRLLLANFIVRSLAWFIIGLSQHIYTLIAVEIIIGITEAIGTPSFNSLVSDHLDQNKHIRDWGAWELLKNPAIALASVCSGLIVARFGFTMLFYIASILSFSSFLLYLRRAFNTKL